MIGSWFLAESTWTWEVVTAAGATVATGISRSEEAASWDCRIAMYTAKATGGDAHTDVALLRPPVSFGGRWKATPVSA